jgi:hypothetical protein
MLRPGKKRRKYRAIFFAGDASPINYSFKGYLDVGYGQVPGGVEGGGGGAPPPTNPPIHKPQ